MPFKDSLENGWNTFASFFIERDPLDAFDHIYEVYSAREAANEVKEKIKTLMKGVTKGAGGINALYTDFKLAESPEDTHHIYVYKKYHHSHYGGSENEFHVLDFRIKAKELSDGKYSLELWQLPKYYVNDMVENSYHNPSGYTQLYFDIDNGALELSTTELYKVVVQNFTHILDEGERIKLTNYIAHKKETDYSNPMWDLG